MELWIRHYKGDEVTEEHWTSYPLEHAKDIVCRWVRDGTVDHVEVRNPDNELIFHYPLEVRSA